MFDHNSSTSNISHIFWSSTNTMIGLWCLNITFIIGSISILAILLVYRRKRTGWNKTSQIIQITLAILMSVFIIVRLVLSGFVLSSNSLIQNNRNANCKILIAVSSCWLDVTVLPVFLFLWHRQKILYRQPLLEHLHSSFIKFLSNFCLALILVKTIIYPTWFIISKEIYFLPNFGCMVKRNESVVGWVALFINLIMFSTITVLCVLYIVPLYEQISSKRKSSEEGRGSTRSKTKLLKFTISNTACIGICFSATLISILVNKLVFTLENPPYTRYMVNNAVLFVYQGTLLFLFDRCSDVVLELYQKSKKHISLKKKSLVV